MADSKQRVEAAEAALSAAEASRTEAVASLEAEVHGLRGQVQQARQAQAVCPRDISAEEKARQGTALAALQAKLL